MPWAKLDDQYPDHPKVVKVGPLGMALHVAALCYCARYLTDGFIPIAMIPRLISLDGIFIISNAVSNAVTHKMITDELTDAGLFEIVEGGFKVHDYLDYNPPAELVKKERAENAARQKAWKVAHPKKTKGNAVSDTVNNDVPSPSPSPSPNEDNRALPEVPFPPSLNCPEFIASWNEWLVYRKEIKHEMTDTTQKMQFAQLKKYTPAMAIAMLEQSMTNGWRGLFEIKNGNSKPMPEQDLEAQRAWRKGLDQ